MGWLVMLGLAAALLLGLWRFLSFDRAALQFLGAGIAVALAGYVWQGRPDFPGAPRPEAARAQVPDNVFGSLRRELFGPIHAGNSWLTIADSYLRRGDTRSAAGIIRSGLRQQPEDATLWIGLGNALVLHSAGTITPAADLAFARAKELAPDHPGPGFFHGLALAQGGRFAEAEREWRALAEGDLPDGAWRAQVEGRLALIERARALGQLPPRED